MTLHKTIVILCGFTVFTILIGAMSSVYHGHTYSKPTSEYIPICWNQTVPDVPMWHQAAKCDGKINRN